MTQDEKEQPHDAEPAEEEVTETESVESEEELLHKLREQQRELRQRMRTIDKDLQELRKRKKRSVHDNERHQFTPGFDGDNDRGGFEIHIERTADNLGRTIEAYVGNIMDSMADGIEGALDGIFSIGDRTHSRRRRIIDRRRKAANRMRRKYKSETYTLTEDDRAIFPKEGAAILSILSDERRLRILQELESGPEYQKELSENTDVKGGQWKHHADLLKEAGFIDQEAVRGRYLITQIGREALKLAEMLYIRKKTLEKVPSSADEAEGDNSHEDEFDSGYGEDNSPRSQNTLV